MTQTTFKKLAEIEKKWYLIDLEGIVLGRVASHVALILRGKNKADYTPFLDDGDNVVVINADKVKLTGRKLNDKKYYWHTGYPGGIKETTVGKLLAKKPEEVFKKAVKNMLPRGPLGRKQFKNLYVYAGTEYAQTAQNPEIIDFAKLNEKNKR
jgi:large subunit ribosomal protein L13